MAMDSLHLPDPSAAPHPDSALRLASTVHRFSIVSVGLLFFFVCRGRVGSTSRQSASRVATVGDSDYDNASPRGIIFINCHYSLLPVFIYFHDKYKYSSFILQPFINPGDQLSYEASFKSCSAGHPTTTSVILQADSHRHAIKKNMADGRLSHAALSKALQEYMYVLFDIYYRLYFMIPLPSLAYVFSLSFSYWLSLCLQTVDQPDSSIL